VRPDESLPTISVISPGLESAPQAVAGLGPPAEVRLEKIGAALAHMES
jgi:hypothetical protein